MQNIIVTFFIFFMSLFYVTAQKQHSFPVKSGIIDYVFENRTKGIETFRFDDYGDLLNYTKKTGNNTTVSIVNKDKLIILDKRLRLADVYNSAEKNIISKLIITPALIKEMGFKFVGNDTVAGKICKKYSGENGNLWIWNDIVLESETEIMGIKIYLKAVDVKTGIDIPRYNFQIPDGYKIISHIEK